MNKNQIAQPGKGSLSNSRNADDVKAWTGNPKEDSQTFTQPSKKKFMLIQSSNTKLPPSAQL